MKDLMSVLKIVAIVFFIMGGIFFIFGAAFLIMYFVPTSPLGGETFALLGIIFIVVGIVMAVIAGIMLNKFKKTKEQIQWLRENGTFIQGEILSCEQDYSLTINNKPTYIVKVSYKDPFGKTYIFTRKGITKNPETSIKDGKVTVLCARDDYSKYYIDIENSVDPNIIEF